MKTIIIVSTIVEVLIIIALYHVANSKRECLQCLGMLVALEIMVLDIASHHPDILRTLSMIIVFLVVKGVIKNAYDIDND